MKKLLVVGVFLNAALLFAIWREVSAVAEGGGAGLVGPAPEVACYDANGDGSLDVGDPVALLNWLFLGRDAPEVCPSVDGPPAVPEVDGFRYVETNPTTGLHEYTHEQTGIEFVLLPGGDFEMGSPPDECGRFDDELLHTVTLSPFLIAKYEVTQAEYEAVMTGHATLNPTPSFFTGDDLPVESVSWNELKDADGFLARTGLELPSEAQWEYACRAGTTTRFAYGETLDSVSEANFAGLDKDNFRCSDVTGNTFRESTIDVGSLLPNAFGLYDMHGNVWEWCEDAYNSDFYAEAAAAGPDPVSTTGSFGKVAPYDRVNRGGEFRQLPAICRSALRNFSHPGSHGSRGAEFSGSFGFRPVRPLP